MKLIVTLSILLNVAALLLPRDSRSLSARSIDTDSIARYKINAFTVLQNKCNVCHSERNRNAVFTFNNMDIWSMKINEQVFIKERMPKGNTIVLTDLDKSNLRKWLQTLKQ